MSIECPDCKTDDWTHWIESVAAWFCCGCAKWFGEKHD
jgi:hypothetical protein